MTFVLVSIVSVSVVLGVLVLVHELGHFVVAKLCGVRVETFSIGFGTRLFGFHHGGTDYCVRLLPLGGYVKMAGESPVEKATGEPNEYASHPRWQRILIACAGPAANFLLALVLMTIVYVGYHDVENYISAPAVVDYVQPNSEAAAAGLQKGDRILLFDNVSNPSWQQIMLHSELNLNHSVAVVAGKDGQEKQLTLHLKSPADPDSFALEDVGITPVEQSGPLKIAAIEPDMAAGKAGLKAGDEIVSVDGMTVHSVLSIVLYLQQNGDRPVTLGILRDGKPISLRVQPEKVNGPNGQPSYQIGFQAVPPPFHRERLSLSQAFVQSVKDNAKESTLIVDVLHRVITNRTSSRTLMGPVGIARATGHIVSLPGWAPLINETAVLSVNLGIVNLVPIPILDGGVILFLLIESIMQRDLNEKFKERVYQGAFVFLVLLMVFIIFSDLSKIPAFSRLRL
jgi:regulator of sigma E protease